MWEVGKFAVPLASTLQGFTDGLDWKSAAVRRREADRARHFDIRQRRFDEIAFQYGFERVRHADGTYTLEQRDA